MKSLKDKRARILIVDDTPKNIQLLGSVLKRENYHINVAQNGRQALDVVEKVHPDLILLDIMMPEMDGFQCCEVLKLHEETKDIPVIFLTAKSEPEDVVKGFGVGAVDYVTKPFNHIELLARVRTHLELKFSRDLLKQLVDRDGLTGLYNHRYIIDQLNKEISKARRHEQDLSIIMFDLDHFKSINDNFGHQLGDQVLELVSGKIRETLRLEDIPGRYGGEEFLIILPATTQENALVVAEKIRRSIQEMAWEPAELKVTISGGMCSLIEEMEESAQMIQKADLLLYQAKRKGRNRIEAVLEEN